MIKSKNLLRYKGRPMSLIVDPAVKEAFKRLIDVYDPGLSMNRAVTKAMAWMVEMHWLPGYEPKNKPEMRDGYPVPGKKPLTPLFKHDNINQ